jgi:hypothetical protein
MRIPERRCRKYQTIANRPGQRHLIDCFISEIAPICLPPLLLRITWIQNNRIISYKVVPDFPSDQAAIFDRLSALKARVKRHNFDVEHGILGPKPVAVSPDNVIKSDNRADFNPRLKTGRIPGITGFG